MTSSTNDLPAPPAGSSRRSPTQGRGLRLGLLAFIVVGIGIAAWAIYLAVTPVPSPALGGDCGSLIEPRDLETGLRGLGERYAEDPDTAPMALLTADLGQSLQAACDSVITDRLMAVVALGFIGATLVTGPAAALVIGRRQSS